MICENRYCIYWENGKCTLDEIYLDELGICESCIRISIPDEKLHKIREKQLEELESRFRE